MTKHDNDQCIWCGGTDTREFCIVPRVIIRKKDPYGRVDDDETVTPLRLLPHSKAVAKFLQLNKQDRIEAIIVRS